MSLNVRIGRLERELKDFMDGRYTRVKRQRLMRRLIDPDEIENVTDILGEMLCMGKPNIAIKYPDKRN